MTRDQRDREHAEHQLVPGRTPVDAGAQAGQPVLDRGADPELPVIGVHRATGRLRVDRSA